MASSLERGLWSRRTTRTRHAARTHAGRHALRAIAADLVGRASRAGGEDSITALVVERLA